MASRFHQGVAETMRRNRHHDDVGRADGSGEVAGLPNGQRGFVPARRTGAWVLVPMRVEGGQVEWMDAPPETAVAWPQTIFIEGGAR